MAAAEPITVCDQTDLEIWREWRRTGIGASEAPAIEGVSTFDSPASLAAKKAGLITDTEENNLMKWGRRMEPFILADFLEEMEADGQKGWSGQLAGKLLRHGDPDLDFMLATLDADLQAPDGSTGLGEIKNIRFTTDEWAEGVPEKVIVQAQHAMEVRNVEWAVVIALLDPYHLAWKRIERDRAYVHERLIPNEREWWRKFEAGEEQDWMKGRALDANLAALAKLYPKANGNTVHLAGEENEQLVEAWALERAERLKHEKREKALKAGLKAKIGEHSFATFDNGTTLNCTLVERNSYQVKASSYRQLKEVR